MVLLLGMSVWFGLCMYTRWLECRVDGPFLIYGNGLQSRAHPLNLLLVMVDKN
jgi:hypothetical protein